MNQFFNFTKPSLEALPFAEPGQRVTYHDRSKQGIGLQLRVTSTAKTFFVQKRVKATPRRFNLGRFPELTIEQARKQAAKVLGQIAEGIDPHAEKKKKQLEAKTLKAVLNDYFTVRKSLKPITKQDMVKAMNEVCPDWLSKPLGKITPDMVAARHKEHGERRSKARANLAMRYLRALFNFASAEYQTDDGVSFISTNPVNKLSQTKAWFRVSRRQTVIKAHELGVWVEAVRVLHNLDIRDYFMVVLLTGMRREEALRLRWIDVDLKEQTFIIRDPKNHRDHRLPMSDFVFDIFNRRRCSSVSEFVFADAKDRKISNFRYAMATIKKATGIDFCLHDLRRTFATVAESLDIPAYALKRLLNHADGNDVTAGYIVPNVGRLRDPMQKITDFVLSNERMNN